MSFRLAALALALCALSYGQANRRGQAARSIRTDRYGDVGRGGLMNANGRYIIPAPDCSAAGQMPPNPAAVSPEDFVELERSMCFGSCPAYRVRLYRTGKIDWLPGHSTLPQEVYKTTADPVEAAALLDRSYAREFWSACENYPVGEDAPTYHLRISIGGKRKAIKFGGAYELEWLEAFTSDLDRIVDTHRRFHGDPATEVLDHLWSEIGLSKRGLTPLMRAASTDNLEEIAELLAAGAPVDQQDASGWTALMYAAGSYADKKAVSALLEAGANPNHMDLARRTPLMAARGPNHEKILAATRTVNHQSQQGVSALMVMARTANAEGIRLALSNDADPALTDANAHTAWDYLMQSYCGRILVPSAGDPTPVAAADEAQQCWDMDRLLRLPAQTIR